MTLFRTLAAAVVLALTFSAAHAQAPFRTVRGEVTELSSGRIAVRTATGVVAMRLAPEWSVQVFRPMDVADIPTGAFVGVVETPLADGAGRAHEVHRFEKGVRMGEGRQPWDRPPGSTLTSGDIGPVARTQRGHEFDVSFAGGKRRIVVPAHTPVVLISNEGREHIRVGVKVFILAWPEDGGPMRVDAVATGPDGAEPPL